MIILLIGAYFVGDLIFKNKQVFLEQTTNAYLSSSDEMIKVYDTEYNELELPRGADVSLYEKEVKSEEGCLSAPHLFG